MLPLSLLPASVYCWAFRHPIDIELAWTRYVAISMSQQAASYLML